MSQQNLSKTANDKYVRKLFQNTGFGFVLIASSSPRDNDNQTSLNAARLIEEYSTPTMKALTSEIELINAPGRIQVAGKSCRKISVKILFDSKQHYINFMNYLDRELKYYDENGQIFYCGVMDYPEITRHDVGKRIQIKLNLIAVKKDRNEADITPSFSDVSEKVMGAGAFLYDNPYKEAIEGLAHLGIITQKDRFGNFIYVFRPEENVRRSEAGAFLNRLRKDLERMIKG